MKVLVSAYACEPGMGSEPGTGWEWSRAAALDHDVWLLTRENNAPAIEIALEKEPHLRLNPVYIDLPAWARFWKHGQRGVHVYYLLWQILAWRKAAKLHRAIRFDVAHHLTLAVDWMPAGIAWVRGLPFVWGPVGGATGTPWRMWRWLGWRGILSEALREIVTRSMRRMFCDPIARRANLVVAQNHDVARRFWRMSQVVMEPHVVVEPPLDIPKRPIRANGPLRAVFAGRLIPWKGLAVAVEAIAKVPKWTLDVYGDGPDRRRGEKLARQFGAEDRIRFQGLRPRSALLAELKMSDVLIHPSMHDSAAWVVGEAASAGVLVLHVERGGPPVLVDNLGGIGVPADEHAAAGLAAALSSLAARSEFSADIGASSRWSAERLPGLLACWYQQE